MTGERIVIVGGGAAGNAAARGYRDAGGAGRVVMVTDDDRPPYRRPPLSKELLRGDVDEAELPLEPAGHVEVVFGRAVELDVEARCVRLADGRGYEYDGCVLATGAEPVRAPIAGADAPHVRTLRTVPDSLGIADAARSAGSVAVIGSGFIGCELAASLAMTGAAVRLSAPEAAPNDQRLGSAAGARVAAWLEELGVELKLGAALDRLPEAELVVMATGVAPRVRLAAAAGLRLSHDLRAVAADRFQRTTGDRVYAAGDVCEAVNGSAGRPLRVEHWGDALEQGEVAGRRLAGDVEVAWDGVPGFWSVIGSHTLKYAAWGDGFAGVRLVDHDGSAWTAWYTDADGACVGVLAHECDRDYERGRELIAAGAVPP